MKYELEQEEMQKKIDNIKTLNSSIPFIIILITWILIVYIPDQWLQMSLISVIVFIGFGITIFLSKKIKKMQELIKKD